MNQIFILSAGFLLTASNIFALTAPGEDGQTPYSFFFLIGSLFLIMYFFVIRPQQKKAKRHKEMVSSLKKDDEVMLSSGIYGKIVKMPTEPDKMPIQVEIADKVVIKVAKDSLNVLVSAKAGNRKSTNANKGKGKKKSDDSAENKTKPAKKIKAAVKDSKDDDAKKKKTTPPEITPEDPKENQ